MNDHIRDSLKIGTQLNNYIIQAVLGQGAFGITYLAHDKNLNYFVAIKEYLPRDLVIRDEDMTVSPFSINKSAQFNYGLESFLREAQTIAKFKHPNIVRILTFFRKNNTAYIVMEYEKGKTLKSYVEERNNLSEKRLLDIFCPINDGLLLMHKKGYIHRDIKPDNIVIREDNTPVLIDFGTARDTLNSNSSDLTQIFTSGYAPFEQCHPTWAEQGAWTDIYSLGATLYFAITGKRIIASELRMVNDPYQKLVYSDNRAYGEHFLKAIDDALLFQPKERPQNLEDWNQALSGSYINNEHTYNESSVEATHTINSKGTIRNRKNIYTNNTNFRNPDKTTIYGNRSIDENLNIVDTKKSLTKNKIFYIILFFILVVLTLYLLLKTEEDIISEPPIPVFPTLPVDIKKEVEGIILKNKIKLSNNALNFSEAVSICNNINIFLNQYPNKGLREIYLSSLQKTLDLIPKIELETKHLEWLKVHENNIKKDKFEKYIISSDFRKSLLGKPYLYGMLVVESPNVTLDIEISGGSLVCTHNEPCKSPLKINKIRSGGKNIKLSNKYMKIEENNEINIHPYQEYILYIE